MDLAAPIDNLCIQTMKDHDYYLRRNFTMDAVPECTNLTAAALHCTIGNFDDRIHYEEKVAATELGTDPIEALAALDTSAGM